MDVATVREQVRETFRKNLNRIIEARGMKQAELAKLIGVSAPTVNDWVKGRKVPRMDKIDKLCSIFSVGRSDLLDAPKEITINESFDASRLVLDAQAKAHVRAYLSLSKEDRAKVDEYTELLADKARDAGRDSQSSTAAEDKYA